jgi:hypothetical protein
MAKTAVTVPIVKGMITYDYQSRQLFTVLFGAGAEFMFPAFFRAGCPPHLTE